MKQKIGLNMLSKINSFNLAKENKLSIGLCHGTFDFYTQVTFNIFKKQNLYVIF